MPDVAVAFLLAAIVALTLPLGALIARLWNGSSAAIGLMTAFGAGALISGVAVDLVGESIEQGTYVWFGLGAVLGGVLFTTLNGLINSRGGFLRKASTTITYLRGRQLLRRRKQLSRLQRISWFDDLNTGELEAVAELLIEREYPKGAHIHRAGDRTEYLTVLTSGKVELQHRNGRRETIVDDAFGTTAFLTGAPHVSTAVALEQTRVYRLPRRYLFDVIDNLPELRSRLADDLDRPEVAQYLADGHGVEPGDMAAWKESITSDEPSSATRVIDVDRPETERLLQVLQDLPWTVGLERDDLKALARRLFVVRYDDGEVLYQKGDRGDRMFVVDDGEIHVVAPSGSNIADRALPGDHFGSYSFATGTTRAGTAIAVGQATAWVMRRRDLTQLLGSHQAIREAWLAHLQSPETLSYLRDGHGMSTERASEVVREARDAATAGQAPPEMIHSLVITGGAAIAIWLGIALDGIPESLVIGASVGRGVPIALIAGAILSNIPESLASSRGMVERGMSWRTVSLMWGSLVVLAAAASVIGQVTLAGAGEETAALIEGVTGGAIIAVATETMFPEAYERTGPLTGLAALFGFLVAAGMSVALG